MANPLVDVVVMNVKYIGIKKLPTEPELCECEALLVSSVFGKKEDLDLAYYVVRLRKALHSRVGETYMHQEMLKISRKFDLLDKAQECFDAC